MRRRTSKKEQRDPGPSTTTTTTTPTTMGLQTDNAGSSAAAAGASGSSSSGGGGKSAGHYTSSNMFGLRAEGYELKADGKKRKFKPLEAMRKFFGKGKRKSKDDQVSVVAVKAKSTTALHHSHNDNDEDDDGGFKSRQPRPLGGNRSISEDSVFSPEQRESNLQALKQTAVSEESLPKSAFQAELFSKLNKRRSQYSDDDDGLPHSPTPPVTTADIIMGGPLKPLPGAGKSTSRESDNSLISMDGSENDEDDPFKSQWKSSVASKVSKTSQKPGGTEGPIDFEKMEHTSLLKSDVAKDRISVKPRARKATRQSRKKRDGQSPHSLPSLNEESPTKPSHDDTSDGSLTDITKEEVKIRSPRKSPEKTKRVISDRPASMASSEALPFKPSSDSSPIVMRPNSTILSTSPPKAVITSDQAKPEPKRSSFKMDTPPEPKESATPRGSVIIKKETESESSIKTATKTEEHVRKPENVGDISVKIVSSKTVEFLPKKSEAESSGVLSSSLLSTSTSSMASGAHNASVMTRSEPSIVFAKTEPPSTTKPKADFATSSIKSSSSQGFEGSAGRPESATSARVTINSSTPAAASTSSSIMSASFTSVSSPGEHRKDGLKQTDTQASPAFSPKDDYKLRRQSRSRTLPEHPISKDELFASKVQRTASHRVETTSSQNASPETSPRHKDTPVEAAKSNEPEWFALARRKTGSRESESATPGKDAVPSKDTAPPTVSEPPPVTFASTPKVEIITKAETVPAPKTETVSAPKTETDTKSADTSSASLAGSKFERFKEVKPSEAKPTEVSRMRGGSVKTSPTKTNVFANRGGSVKVSSPRSEVGTTSASSSVPSSLVKITPTPSSSLSSSTPVVKIEEKKEEIKTVEHDVPKWKAQSVKTPSTFSSTASSTPSAVSSARFSSVKAPSSSSSSSSTPFATPVAKTEVKPASPVKTASTSKAPPEEKSVPAWRANLKPASDIKIELIESPSTPSSTAATKKEDTAKKQDSPTKTAAPNKDLQADQCRGSATSGRTSKVMNLLKNFENLQGVS